MTDARKIQELRDRDDNRWIDETDTGVYDDYKEEEEEEE